MNNGVQKDWNSEKNSVKARRENNSSNIFFSPFFRIKERNKTYKYLLGWNDRVDGDYQIRSSGIPLGFYPRHHRAEQQRRIEEDRDLEQHEGNKFYEKLQGGVHSNRGESSKQDFYRNDYTGESISTKI